MLQVSIIIPVYNTEDFIEECILSVLNQTYQDLEIIIIDDCGSDHSIDIVRNILKSHNNSKNVTIISHPHNSGLSAARNTGIKYAKGNYLFFLDSDDFLSIDAIENLVSCLKKYPNSDIIYGATQLYPSNWSNLVPDIKKRNLKEYYSSKYCIQRLMLNRKVLPETAHNKLLRTKFIKDNCLFFKEGITHEDTLYIYFLAKYATRIAFYKGYTYYYRKNQHGIVQTQSNEEYAHNLDSIIKDCIKNIDFKLCLFQLLFIIHLVHTNLILRKKIEVETALFVKILQIIKYFYTLKLYNYK